MFKFWKKGKKKEDIPPLPQIEGMEKGKDEIEIALIKIEKIELRLQNIGERLEKIEKMVEEIYRIAKS